MSVNRNKKGIMGIGTLIIFIATILVAAVAAGVIISTAGLLQQKSLLVGDEARNRLVNTVEVISVIAAGNVTTEKLNDFESLLRTGPGSNPIQLRTMGISMLTDNLAFTTTLAHTGVDNSSTLLTSNLTGAWQTISDRDGDGISEQISLYNGTDGYLDVVMNLSNPNKPQNATADLGQINISGASYSLLDEVAGLFIDSNEEAYGYILIDGQARYGFIGTDAANTTIQTFVDQCTFDLIAPEVHWCYQVRLGSEDTVLEGGEAVNILFRLKDSNALSTDEDFEITFYPDRGALSRIKRKTPDVITSVKVFVFP